MIVRRLNDFALLIQGSLDKGLLLFIAAFSAIILTNIGYVEIYSSYIHSPIEISFMDHSMKFSVELFVNEFLMAIFFFVVGMEIKREIMQGHLSDPAQRILPIAAAIAGVVMPILIYIAFNSSDQITLRAWAVPAATDIAFALGVISIFGRKIPKSLKIFLTALAIIDDLIAVAMIAVFYTDHINFLYIYYIMGCVLFLTFLNHKDIASSIPYLIAGILLWFCFLKSGIHTTIAGVILGFLIPLKTSSNYTPIANLEKSLGPITSYIIVPIFAFVNSGVYFGDFTVNTFLNSKVALGIALGLFLGKQIGIFSTGYLLSKFKLIKLPSGANLLQLYGISVICGVGFTMSLFIAALAFRDYKMHISEAKIGILIGSFISMVFAILIFVINSYIKIKTPNDTQESTC